MNSERNPAGPEEGRFNQLLSSARDAIREGLKKAGDIIESAGDKVEHAGLKRLGDWIERVGNTIEQLGDRDAETHSSTEQTPLQANPGMRTATGGTAQNFSDDGMSERSNAGT
jgi:hypothetical protein